MYLIEFWSQFVSRNRSLSFKEMTLRLVCTRKRSTTSDTFICVIRLMMGNDIKLFELKIFSENISARKAKHEDISNMYLIDLWSQFVSRNESLSFKEMEFRLVCTRKGSTTTGTFICVIGLMVGEDIKLFDLKFFRKIFLQEKQNMKTSQICI